MADISIEKIQSVEALMTRWAPLYEKAKGASFYQSPPWVKIWAEFALELSDVYLIEAGEDGAPAMSGVVCVGRRRPPLLGMRQAYLQETGNASLDEIYVEYNDFLTTKPDDVSLRMEMISALLSRFPQMDCLVFRNATGAFVEATDDFNSRWRRVIWREHSSYIIDLAAVRQQGAEVIQRFSGSLRSKINRSLKAYAERGAVTAKLAATADEKADAWRMLIELHNKQWRLRGKAGAFESKQFIAFHERLQSSSPEIVHLFEVRCGDDVVGVLYNFIHGGRVLNYQSGFSFENDNRLAPGFLSHALAAQHYLNKGYDCYDLLAGDAEYKQRLGVASEKMTSLSLERTTSLRIRLRDFLKELRGSRHS